MKEIGGYFGLEKLVSHPYYGNLIALNSARNALAYLIKARNIKKLYIPYYLCDSVSGVCEREHCRYEYYHTGKDFMPQFSKHLSGGEYLYIVNYFGQLDNSCVTELKKQYPQMILDNVQAFFQKPMEDVDTIYSCRKFFGVPDGAYLSTNAPVLESVPQDCSGTRLQHIIGRLEGPSASAFYADFCKNEKNLDTLKMGRMSVFTRNIMGAIDYETVCKIRESNFIFLHSRLKEANELSVHCPEGPYVYPFLCRNGSEIRKSLADRKIYVATLWPNVLDMSPMPEQDYAENILPLPCDQRYSIDDMKRITETLMELIR